MIRLLVMRAGTGSKTRAVPTQALIMHLPYALHNAGAEPRGFRVH
jgi:hypothetical protein